MTIEKIRVLICKFARRVADYENITEPTESAQAYLDIVHARQKLEDAIKQYKEQK